MAQFGRPEADSDNSGSWTEDDGTTVDLFDQIDEAVADDADYVKSPSAPSSAVYVTRLSDIEDPVAATGHILRVRMRKSAAGGSTINATVELREGYVSEASQGTLIATVGSTSDIDENWTEYSHTLSAGEANSITDYTDLHVRIVATQV